MPAKNVRISIVIPCFNEERYLKRCLDSVAAQHEPAYEVIVVDNNSRDGTAEITRQYPSVRLIKEPQQGRAYAQHTGFQAARGTILARIDADAVLPADWTRRIAAYFEQSKAQHTAWTGGAAFYNVRLPRITNALYGLVAFGYNRLLTGQPSLWGSSMALPRAMWRQVAPTVCLRSDLHEDLDVSIHVQRAGYRIFHDRHTRVGVELRPAYAGPARVWEYLQMWPRTLRIHGLHSWLLCWPVNLVIFVCMPFFGLSERTARLFGRRPLSH